MIDVVLLVDLGAIYWHAWHASNRDTAPDAPADATVSRVRRWAESYRHVAVCLDDPAGSFRADLYAAYKANRGERPEGAREQLARAIDLLRRDGFPCWSWPRHEADDVIASACALLTDQGRSVQIATRDKDLHSLVRDSGQEEERVAVLDYVTGELRGEAEVRERFGVSPHEIPDWIVLVGDTSDNIPGVPGIGPKRAAELLALAEGLDGIYQAALDEHRGIKPAIRESLLASRETVELARRLVALVDVLPIPIAELDAPRAPRAPQSAPLPRLVASSGGPTAHGRRSGGAEAPVQSGRYEHMTTTPQAAPSGRLQITKGAPKRRPLATILTGQSGIGKTYFASTIEGRFWIGTEDGLAGASRDHVDTIHRFESADGALLLPRSLGELIEQIDTFRGAARGIQCRHLVVDGLSGIERLVNLQTCKQESVAGMESKDFAKVYRQAIPHWQRVLDALDRVRDAGVHVWVIAHAVDSTSTVAESGETFVKADIALQGSGKALAELRQLWRGWADNVLFIDWDTNVRQGKNIGQKAVAQHRARVMHCVESAQRYAKTRCGLPDRIPATWADLSRAIRAGVPAPEARLRRDIEAILPQLEDAQREEVTAELAAAKGAPALAAVLSRAQGMAATRERDEEPRSDDAAPEAGEEAAE